MSFSPVFFRPIKTLNHDVMVLHCITLFSVSDNENTLPLFDQNLASYVITTKTEYSYFELFSILFNFDGLLKAEVPIHNVILAARKLYALGFFMMQIPIEERSPYYREVRYLIEIVTRELNTYPGMSSVLSCSVAFCLTQILPHLRSNDISAPESNDLVDISLVAMKLYKAIVQTTDGSNPVFQAYFLYLIQTFNDTPDCRPEIFDLIHDIISLSSKSLYISENINFNYASLIDKLQWILNTDIKGILPETKVLILVLLTKICGRYSVGTDYFFDDQNIEQISTFVLNYISNLDFSGAVFKEENELFVPSLTVPVRTKISATFEKDYVLTNEEISKEFNTQLNIPPNPSCFMRHPILNVMVSALTQFAKFRSDYISKFLVKFMELSRGKRTYEVLVFAAVFVRSVMVANIQNYEKELVSAHIIQMLLGEALVKYTNDDLLVFVSNLNLILMKSENNYYHSMLALILPRFERCFTRLQNPKMITTALCQAAVSCPIELQITLQENKFDLRIANLMFLLQNLHFEFSKQLETAEEGEQKENMRANFESVQECRKSLFKFIFTLLTDPICCAFCFESEPLVESIIQHVYEENVSTFALSCIKKALYILDRNSKVIIYIYNFFCQTLEKARLDQEYLPFARAVIETIYDVIEYNSIAIASNMLSPKFVDLLISLALETKDDSDLLAMLKLAQRCSKLQGKFKEFFTSFDLFSKIKPLVVEIAKSSGKQKLVDNLWYIVFDDQQLPDQFRTIYNAEPLSLIFSLMETDDEKYKFLNYLNETCEVNAHSGLQINNSSFTTTLVQFLCNYRNVEEIDKLFAEASRLFTFLSQYSVKANDLMTIFQNMTALPNGKKPIVTNDFLMSLLLIFQTPFEAPSSFFHLTERDACIAVSPMNLTSSLSNFTIIVDLELISATNKGKLIYLESWASKNQLTFSMAGTKLKYSYRDDSKADYQDFDIDMQLNQWTTLIITYDGSFLRIYNSGKLAIEHDIKIKPFTDKLEQVPICLNMNCNVGICGLSNICIPANLVKLIGRLPRSSMTTFDPVEKGDFPQMYEPIFTKEIAESFLFLLSASISNNDKVANMSHLHTKPSAAINNSTTFGYYPNSSMVISAIGGAGVLIPFFAQLDMATGKSDVSDPGFLAILVKLLIAFLRDNPGNQQNFASIKGFEMIGNLIARASTRHLTLQAVELFKVLFMELKNDDLIISMIQDIFLDVRVWMYADLKVHVAIYQSLNDIYEKGDEHLRYLFRVAAPANKILFIIKTCYWCKPTPKLSLFAGPKIMKNSKETEIHRPAELSPVRAELWKLSAKIFRDSFTEFNSLALVYFATDADDLALTFETLRFMGSMIQSQDQKLVDNITKYLNFDSFFQLLLSEREELHILCMHIFVKFSKLERRYRELFLKPYTFEEWVDSILAVLNTNKNSHNLADVIFGYIFGLYDEKSDEGILKVAISQLKDDDKFNPNIEEPSVCALGIMAITPFDDDLACVYLSNLQKALKKKYRVLHKAFSIETALLFFIMSHCPEEASGFDNSSKIALNILASLYSSAEKNLLDEMIVLFDILSERIQADYTYIPRAVLLEVMKCSLSGEHAFATEKLLLDVINTIFTFLFAIPNTSKFYSFPYSEKDSPKVQKLSFQELAMIRMGHDATTFQYSYATRTTEKGAWLDAELAECLLSCIEGMPDYFTPNQVVSGNQKSLYFMYGFTLAIGLIHAPNFMTFSNHIRFLTNKIPSDRSLNPAQRQAFICYIAGLSNIYIRTDRNHVSHIYMTEDVEVFSHALRHIFNMKQKIQWGSSIDSFEGCFKSRGHHFAHDAMQEFSNYENDMLLFVKEYEKNVPKIVDKIINASSKVSANFAKLNDLATSLKVLTKKQKVNASIMQFASELRNEMNIGAKIYKTLIRTLSQQGGPWNSPDSKHDIHFKLDDTMQKNFRRGKMIENTLYTDHKHASFLRDTGNITNAQMLYTDHLKQLRMATFAGEEDIVFGEEVSDEKIQQDSAKNEDSTQNILIKIDARLVTMKKVHSGSATLTPEYLIFESSNKFIRIETKTIESVFLRHYLLLDTSVEIYTTAMRAIFLDFPGGKRKSFLDVLKKQKFARKVFIQQSASDINQLVRKATEMWCDGLLSNFDYLMRINIYSGRTYNDLSQYPVFPWILSDYSSDELDLTNPKSFRDLSKPIGVLDQDRLAIMVERSNSSDSDDTRYLFGSLYSSAAVVIGFLVRMEPFTSLHIELQSGRFDISDRLFHSIPRAWESVNHTTMDFRELIPEFFYLPDFLLNSNNFDLGKSAPNDGHVVLPPWAKSPSDFVRKNREALESPIATAGLPQWIDLIFGIKSRGKLAIECQNHFCPYFFTDCITKEVIRDPVKFKFAQEFAACFGMAPQKIFEAPHPEVRELSAQLNPSLKLKLLSQSFRTEIVSVAYIQKNIVAITKDLSILRINQNGVEEQEYIGSGISTGFTSERPMVKINESRVMVASEYDRAFTFFNPLNFQRLLTTRKHSGKITAISVSDKFWATGDSASTIMLHTEDKTVFVPFHRSPIRCLSISEPSDIMIACGDDGFISATSLVNGRTSHTIHCGEDGTPLYCDITESGTVVVIFTDGEMLTIRSFDSNLNMINVLKVKGEFVCASVFEWFHKSVLAAISLKNGPLLIINADRGETVWSADNIAVRVTSITFREEFKDLLMGTLDGEIVSLPLISNM